jgi:hypothetical protein
LNYFRLDNSACIQFVNEILRRGLAPSSEWLDNFVEQNSRKAKMGDDLIDLSALDHVVEFAKNLMVERNGRDKDQIEGLLSGMVHSALCDLPLTVLDDSGFWQFLAVKYFTPFIVWREAGAIDKGTLLTYYSADRNSEMIPLRLFLRGAIGKTGTSYEHSSLLDRATDFWRSHIIRVRTGTAPLLAQEFILNQSNEPMNTHILREFAKLLNRQWSNSELYFLDSLDSKELIDELRQILVENSDSDLNSEGILQTASDSNNARASNSRAKEFDLLFGLLNTPKKLRDLISQNPLGAQEVFEGIAFEYGNVSRLESKIAVGHSVRPFDIDASHAFHIDNLSQARKLEIEDGFGLRPGSLSSRETKVDLLFISGATPYYISFKDADEQAKLGQVSTSTSYLNGTLVGGITDFDFESRIPDKFSAIDTGFSEEQFLKLRRRDQLFAYFKHNFADEWSDYCQARLENANSQILKLGLMMENDRNEFIQFLGQTLAGNLLGDPNYYLVIGSHVVHFNLMLERLRELDFSIKTEVYKPRDKASFIINLEVGDEKYCVTKIEPSFDGASITAEQTKGIIYYFQQHQKDGNNYKKLLLDITK